MLMKRVLLLTVVSLFLCGLQVSAKELRKIVFKVQQMECANCEKKVKNNISFEKGVKKLETDVKKRTVTITYDSEKTDVNKLKEGFAKFKYEAKVISDVEVKD
ncbi:MAG: heavy-metal-associated domain-containing protein [Phocaeicola sp.]|nr:heavy-metal-associated domain-containing protein [Phocaeicola sp.]